MESNLFSFLQMIKLQNQLMYNLVQHITTQFIGYGISIFLNHENGNGSNHGL